jgi:hypothetical protein
MICFPQLSTGAVGQFPIEKRRLSRTLVNLIAGGDTVKLADAAASTVEWVLPFEMLSDEEAAALVELHARTEGRFGAFTFLDPMDNLLCWSEKLDESVWERNSLLTITMDVADPSGGTRATRVANTGSGALAIEQIVNGPGWFQYAFSLLIRSDVDQQIALIRSTDTQTQSANFNVGAEWKRVLLSGKFTGTEESVTFGIEVGSGHSVDLFGIQGEAQPSASGYKATLSRSGLYPSARFMDDDLSVTTVGPNQHSCRIRIHARG